MYSLAFDVTISVTQADEIEALHQFFTRTGGSENWKNKVTSR